GRDRATERAQLTRRTSLGLVEGLGVASTTRRHGIGDVLDPGREILALRHGRDRELAALAAAIAIAHRHDARIETRYTPAIAVAALNVTARSENMVSGSAKRSPIQLDTGTLVGVPRTGVFSAPSKGCRICVVVAEAARTSCHSLSGIAPMVSGASKRICPD